LAGSTDESKNNLYNQVGGIIAVVAPFVEVTTSSLEKKFSEDKKRK